jgi:hypothetical protein
MGGFRSGWQGASAPVVERCEKIDLADFKQHSDTFAEGEGVAHQVCVSGTGRSTRTAECSISTKHLTALKCLQKTLAMSLTR